jgi:hypothetical protein
MANEDSCVVGMTRPIRAAVLIGALTLAATAACGGATSSASGDVCMEEACEELLVVVREGDLLTPDEARSRLRALWEKGQFSNDSEFVADARESLAAWTQGRYDDWLPIATRLGSRCVEGGLWEQT